MVEEILTFCILWTFTSRNLFTADASLSIVLLLRFFDPSASPRLGCTSFFQDRASAHVVLREERDYKPEGRPN
jgi:hypothetical protein